MSKDIRSFFSKGAKSSAAPAAPVSAQKRKPVVLDDSDNEDDKPRNKLNADKSTAAKATDSSMSKKRRVLYSSDEDEPKPKSKDTGSSTLASKAAKLKTVNVNNAFGSAPVKRIEKEKKPKANVSIDVFDADTDDMELMQVDEDMLTSKVIKRESSQNGHRSKKEDKRTPKKEVLKTKNDKTPEKIKTEKKTPEKIRTEKKTPEKIKTEKKTPEKIKTEKKTPEKVKIEKKTPIKEEKRTHDDSQKSTDKDHFSKKKPQKDNTPSSSKKPKKTQDESDLDRSVYDVDEEKHEKRRAMAILYHQRQQRTGPSNPGSKEIPKGKPNCLDGLAFVLTGEYDSMEREEAKKVIVELGGRVTTAISGKTNYIVAGADGGPAKLAKADDLNIPVLSEDDLLDLIRVKSDQAPLNPNSKAAETTTSSNKNVKKSPADKKANKSSSKMDKRAPSPARNEVAEEMEIETEDADEKSKPRTPNEDNVSMPWVDKYKPKTIKDIIGQQGENSNCAKLIKWLKNWYKNNDGTKKHARSNANPWGKKNDDGAAFKAALLSGPPGVGKTTTVQLVCKHLGLDGIEFNASCTRSKKLLQSEVSGLVANKTLFGYGYGRNETLTEKKVLIMDEVDGMAGNEDRGGMAELIAVIKSSKVPVICMCNDRHHEKIRSLANHCFDLRFARPTLNQIKGAVMSILFKEHVKIPPKTIEEIIQATNCDVRQTLNSLSLISANPNAQGSGLRNDNGKKDLKLGQWEVVRRVFSADAHKTMSLNDKSDLFFHDYNLAALFVQQNYLSVVPNGPKSNTMDKVALAADSLSLGDLVESRIRSRMAWSMLPVQAMYSSVLPGEYMSGQITAQINFPGWLGKNSKTQKRSRLAQEVHGHTRIRTSASRESIRLDYAPFLLQNILQPLIDDQNDGVEESLSVIKEYRLLREDIDSLVELSTWPGKKNLWEKVDGRVKAALTRAYNKEVEAYSYSTITTTKKKGSAASDDGDYLNELGGEGDDGSISDDDEDDDKVENDAFIKLKQKKAPAKTSANSKPSTSGTSKKKATSSKKK